MGRSSHPNTAAPIGLALGLITLALYLPAIRNGFVEYDDQQYVTDNAHVQAGLSAEGLKWSFGFHAGNWHPLAWLSHMLDCQIYGAWAGGHHLTSVLFHVGTTLLVFLVLRRMTGSLWRSAAVAALFGWHPLHVESVAWASERKDVLCAFFWMLTLYAYAGYCAKPGAMRYLSALALFVLCLMSKPMAVTLPFVLLLLDYWPLNRITRFQARATAETSSFCAPQSWRRLLLEKLPFLALSTAECALTLHAQQLAIVSTAGLSLAQRASHVTAAYAHYLEAMFFPVHLAVYYPYIVNLPVTTVAVSAGLLLAVTLLAAKTLRQLPWLAVGWCWYLGTLVPVIGLVQVGDQAWADRYTYLPLIGVAIPVVWLAADAIRNPLTLRLMAVGASAGMLVASSIQLSYWKNTWALFDHANKVTHENYMAITVLASQLAQQGKLEEAIALYRQALSYQPTFPETHFFLGNAFDQLGRPDEAVAEYEKALWFKPMQEQTHIFLGIVLGKQKKYTEAIAHYLAALAINPESAVTHNNLARIYHSQGRYDAAIDHYSAALKINPNLALAHNNLGILLLQENHLADGTAQLREALRLNPTNSETRFNLALALNQQGQWSEAEALFAKTVVAGAPDPKAHYEFAKALAHTRQTRQALSEYARALLLLPDYPEALDGLAWILCTDPNPDFRNASESVSMAERACGLTQRQDPVKLRTLAAAYAEAGQYEQAVRTLENARRVATAKKIDLPEAEPMLQRFQQSQPWREQ